MIETFCLRLATGLVLSLLVLPARVVSPRFYRTHLLIALCLLVTAGVLSWESAADATLLWATLGLSAGVAVVAFWLWSAEGVAVGIVALTLLAAMLYATLLALPGKVVGSPGSLMPALEELSASAFLGFATTAMLMGHWYLIASTMSIDPLIRLIRGLAIANAVRIGVAAIAPVGVMLSGAQFDGLAWMWLSARWLAGLLAPLVLVWMAWQSARIRSTQSATGILYVVVIFAFFGELMDQLLQSHLSALAGGTS
jgi:hypothetical protein